MVAGADELSTIHVQWLVLKRSKRRLLITVLGTVSEPDRDRNCTMDLMENVKELKVKIRNKGATVKILSTASLSLSSIKRTSSLRHN